MSDVYLKWYERLPCKDGKRKDFLIPLKTLVLSYYVKKKTFQIYDVRAAPATLTFLKFVFCSVIFSFSALHFLFVLLLSFLL